jgi:Leucine-rich repeat (LRR) protein
MRRFARTFSSQRSLALMLGLAGACSGSSAPPKGQVMVALSTDMSIPKDVSRIRVRVKLGAEVRYEYDYIIAPDGQFHIPGTVAVVEGSTPNPVVTVEVIGLQTQAGKLKARTFGKAITSIPRERIALLQMPVQWLCDGQVADIGEEDFVSTCEPNIETGEETACVAGACQAVEVKSDSLPSYDAALVYGGGDGPDDTNAQCFDTLTCFDLGSDLGQADLGSACSVTLADDGSTPNFALVTSAGSAGICHDGGAQPCYVPLDQDERSGWSFAADAPAGKRVAVLPASACAALGDGRADSVRVTTACATKTTAAPTCGAWSSVTTPKPPASAGGSSGRAGGSSGGKGGAGHGGTAGANGGTSGDVGSAGSSSELGGMGGAEGGAAGDNGSLPVTGGTTGGSTASAGTTGSGVGGGPSGGGAGGVAGVGGATGPSGGTSGDGVGGIMGATGGTGGGASGGTGGSIGSGGAGGVAGVGGLASAGAASTGATGPVADCSGTVTFPSAGLNGIIREVLNKPTGPITGADLAGIVNLVASSNGIDDLTGMECVVNLQTAIFDGNAITDLTPLAGLKSLNYLNVSSNLVTSAAPLAGSATLAHLELANNPLQDLAGLANVSGLLDLSNTGVQDLSPLTGNLGITTLILAGNHVADVAPLSTLASLASLDLSGNPLPSFSMLPSLPPSVTSLFLSATGVTALTPLNALSNLTTLALNSNGISDADLASLEGLPGLTTLDLAGNQLTTLSALAGKASLVVLDASGNQLNDISALANLENVQTLNFADNLIYDITPLVNNPGLGPGDSVDLTNNPTCDLPSIDALIQRGVYVANSSAIRC